MSATGAPEESDAEGFRDGDEADGGGVASGPAGGARDAFANAFQPGPEGSGVDHGVNLIGLIS